AGSGIARAQMEEFARRYGAADSAVLVWSMGITQHAHGTDNVAAIVNLALARGNVGRRGAGLMPIRGHSGVQGGAEMGAYATAFPGGTNIDDASAANLAEAYGFPIGGSPGLRAEEMLAAAGRNELAVLWSSGGNFLEVMPDPAGVEAAMRRVPLRIHQDIIVSGQMLVDPADAGAVLLLPAATRYEQSGGGTETTTERRVAFGPEVRGPRIGEARSEWEIFGDVARRVDPERADLATFASGEEIRAEIARVVPTYAGVEGLTKIGDSVQWGGTRLCEGGKFPTPDGRARFTVVAPPTDEIPDDGRFRLSTRRGRQFNTMVFAERDPITGAERDAVFLADADAARLGVRDGDAVVLVSDHGEMPGRVHLAPMAPGNVQVLFPEGNVLLPGGRTEAASGIPDYTTRVAIRPIESTAEASGRLRT
ncbi:MAG TPA: molybdopterin-dependent oxidoreductase, partial [Acidimicrobiia bacterium]|nr:molybdopterin-dependent oxidoreductase [Acidimicrobiia bacterium]